MADELFDSDSDEDQKRVVLTEKQKRFNKMKETISNIKQFTERHNFSSVETEFNNLLKEFDKSKKVIEESGIPSFFTRALYLLEDKIKNFTPEDKQKLSAANSKSMVAISRKIKKLSAVILESLKTFSENPTPTTDEEGSDEKTDSDFKSDSSSDSIHPLESNDPMVRRQFWLLKKRKDSEESDIEKPKEDEKEAHVIKEKKEHVFKVAEVEVEKEIVVDSTYEGRTNIFKEFVEKRTQKHFDLKYTYSVLSAYLKHYTASSSSSENDDILTEIIMILIPIRIDYSKKLAITHMNRVMWQETFSNIEELLRILKVPANREKSYNTYSK